MDVGNKGEERVKETSGFILGHWMMIEPLTKKEFCRKSRFGRKTSCLISNIEFKVSRGHASGDMQSTMDTRF